MRISLLIILSIGLTLTGLALVLAGATRPGLAGGCFFWPFPLIIACGAGTGGSAYVAIILGIVALVAMIFFSRIWVQRAAGGLRKPDDEPDNNLDD